VSWLVVGIIVWWWYKDGLYLFCLREKAPAASLAGFCRVMERVRCAPLATPHQRRVECALACAEGGGHAVARLLAVSHGAPRTFSSRVRRLSLCFRVPTENVSSLPGKNSLHPGFKPLCLYPLIYFKINSTFL
jgi:hypothetical protein